MIIWINNERVEVLFTVKSRLHVLENKHGKFARRIPEERTNPQPISLTVNHEWCRPVMVC